MKIGKWRQASKDAIAEAVLMFADHYGIHPAEFPRKLSTAEKSKLIHMIDKCYPFGSRDHFPYKAWLKERRIIIDWLNPKEPEPLTGLFAEQP